MGVNLTIKQENFCQKYSECGNASEAYRFAYSCGNCTDEVVWVKASELLKIGKVSVRVKELREALATKAQLKKEDKLVMLEEMLAVRSSDYFANGGEFKGFDALTEAQQLCLASYKKEPTKFGVKETITLYDRLKIIEIHNKMVGDDAPTQHEFNIAPNFNITIDTNVPKFAENESDIDPR